jgi:hypothetical protein
VVIFNSSDIKAGIPARLGVYPTKNVGVITIASNTTLSSSTTDTLPICNIPPNSFMSGLLINLPALGTSLTVSLVDNLASATTYVLQSTRGAAGGTLTMADVLIGVLGQQYAGTAVAIGGAPGTKEVVWASGAQLLLSVATSASATSGATALNIVYMVEWSPVYQAT